MPLVTGQVLQNRYRIVSLLGQGGIRAWDTRLQVPVLIRSHHALNIAPSLI